MPALGPTSGPLFWITIGLAVVVFVVAEALLIVSALRARLPAGGAAEESAAPRPSRAAELAWTSVPALLLALLVIASFRSLSQGLADGAPLVVQAQPEGGHWTFRYPSGVVTTDELRVPADEPITVQARAGATPATLSVPGAIDTTELAPGTVRELRVQAGPGLYPAGCPHPCAEPVAPIRVRALPANEFWVWL